MPRGIYIGSKPSWTASPTLNFTTGTSASVSLPAYLHNPRNRVITYDSPSGLPTGCSIVGASLLWNGSGTAGTTSVSTRAVWPDGSALGGALIIVVAANTATVSWTAPTTNSNGDSFDNSTNDRTLVGYRIYYGTNEAQVEAKASSYITDTASPYQFTGLTAGTWYFLVVAVDGDGDMSSNVVSSSKVIS